MNDNKSFYTDPNTNHLTDDDTKRYFSRFGAAVFFFGVATLVFSYALSILVSGLTQKYAPQLLDSKVFTGIANNLLSFIPIYGIGLPLFLLITKALPKLKPKKKKMSFGGWLGGLCISALAMLAGNYISTFLLTLAETVLGQTPQNPLQELTDASNVVITVLFVCILAPIFEEIFFRKIVCDRLLPLGEGYAVFVSAVFFGLIHQNLYQFAYAFFTGALFAFVYVKTGKLKYSIFYHMLFNFFGAVVAPWIISNVDMDALNQFLEAYPNSDLTLVADPKLWLFIVLLMAYSSAITGMAVTGLILFIIAKRRGRLKLREGVIPPPKEHRLSNILCTTGVAASVTYFVFAFVVPLILPRLLELLQK